MNTLSGLAGNVGANVRMSLQNAANFFNFLFDVLWQMSRFFKQKQVGYLVLLRQILFTGYEALSLIALISAIIGGLIILEGNSILSTFGQSDLLYVILVSVIVRELSCLLTAFIIIARSGTAIATELGNMVLNHEIDALLSIGISPISYLVIPRTIGVVVALLVLSIYFNISGLLGGWMVSYWFNPIDFNLFFSKLLNELTIKDIMSNVIKSILFGIAIAVISSYQGLQVSVATTEVPQRTIKAVVHSLSWIVIIDVAVATAFYFIIA